MNFLFKEILLLTLLSILVSTAKASDCKKLIKFIYKLGGSSELRECIENDQGEVIELSMNINTNLNLSKTSEEFQTLKVLKLYQNNDDCYGYDDDKINLNVSNFKNLEELYVYTEYGLELEYDTDYTEEGPEYSVNTEDFCRFELTTFEVPENINKLTLNNFVLNQNSIDIIASLPNLQSLSLKYCKYDHLNLEPFSNNMNIKSLSINVKASEYLPLDRIPEDIFSTFKGLRRLNITLYTLTQSVVDKIVSLPVLDELYLEATNLNYEMLQSISKMPNLVGLDIKYNDMNNDMIKLISSMVKLRRLTINYPYNNSEKLNYNPLKKLTELRELELDSPNGNYDLSSFTKLHKIRLNNVEIKQKHIDALNNAVNLRSIELKYSSFARNVTFDLNSVRHLHTLHIDTCFNCRRKIAFNFSSLTSLKFLDITNIFFKDLNELKDIKKLKNLERLTLTNESDYGFENFIDEIGSLKNLNYLELNNYANISSSIKSLSNLKTLKINCWEISKIQSLPPEIGKLKNLETLIIKGELTSLPPEIGNLKKLRYLDLKDNKISEIPKEAENLKNLEYINLYGNNLQEVPEMFNNAKYLYYIDLIGNYRMKGEFLTNSYLTTCKYFISENYRDYICAPKKLKCFNGSSSIKLCSKAKRNFY